jgi:GNAT superfamily N-acetyltransferase
MTVPPLEIRTAAPSDDAMLLASIRAYFEYDGIAFDEEKVGAGLRELLSDPRLGRAWLLELRDGAKIEHVGYAIAGFGFDLEFGGRMATLTDLFVEPGHRGKRLGLRALEAIERECRALGLGAIELQVEHDNVEARALYDRHGFRPHTRTPMSKRL